MDEEETEPTEPKADAIESHRCPVCSSPAVSELAVDVTSSDEPENGFYDPQTSPSGRIYDAYSPQLTTCTLCDRNYSGLYAVKTYVQKVLVVTGLWINGRMMCMHTVEMLEENPGPPDPQQPYDINKCVICIPKMIEIGHRLKEIFLEPKSIGSRICHAVVQHWIDNPPEPQSLDEAIQFFIDTFTAGKERVEERALETVMGFINERKYEFYRTVTPRPKNIQQCLLCGKVKHQNFFKLVDSLSSDIRFAVMVYASPYVSKLLSLEQTTAVYLLHQFWICEEHMYEVAKALKNFIEHNLHAKIVMQPFEELGKMFFQKFEERFSPLIETVRGLCEFISKHIPLDPKLPQNCYYCTFSGSDVYYDDFFRLSAHHKCLQGNAAHILHKLNVASPNRFDEWSNQQLKEAYDRLANFLPIVSQRKAEGRIMNYNEMRVLLYVLYARYWYPPTPPKKNWRTFPDIERIDPKYISGYIPEGDPHPYVPFEGIPSLPREAINLKIPTLGYCEYREEIEEEKRQLKKRRSVKVRPVSRFTYDPNAPSTSGPSSSVLGTSQAASRTVQSDEATNDADSRQVDTGTSEPMVKSRKRKDSGSLLTDADGKKKKVIKCREPVDSEGPGVASNLDSMHSGKIPVTAGNKESTSGSSIKDVDRRKSEPSHFRPSVAEPGESFHPQADRKLSASSKKSSQTVVMPLRVDTSRHHDDNKVPSKSHSKRSGINAAKRGQSNDGQKNTANMSSLHEAIEIEIPPWDKPLGVNRVHSEPIAMERECRQKDNSKHDGADKQRSSSVSPKPAREIMPFLVGSKPLRPFHADGRAQPSSFNIPGTSSFWESTDSKRLMDWAEPLQKQRKHNSHQQQQYGGEWPLISPAQGITPVLKHPVASLTPTEVTVSKPKPSSSQLHQQQHLKKQLQQPLSVNVGETSTTAKHSEPSDMQLGSNGSSHRETARHTVEQKHDVPHQQKKRKSSPSQPVSLSMPRAKEHISPSKPSESTSSRSSNPGPSPKHGGSGKPRMHHMSVSQQQAPPRKQHPIPSPVSHDEKRGGAEKKIGSHNMQQPPALKLSDVQSSHVPKQLVSPSMQLGQSVGRTGARPSQELLSPRSSSAQPSPALQPLVSPTMKRLNTQGKSEARSSREGISPSSTLPSPAPQQSPTMKLGQAVGKSGARPSQDGINPRLGSMQPDTVPKRPEPLFVLPNIDILSPGARRSQEGGIQRELGSANTQPSPLPKPHVSPIVEPGKSAGKVGVTSSQERVVSRPSRAQSVTVPECFATSVISPDQKGYSLGARRSHDGTSQREPNSSDKQAKLTLTQPIPTTLQLGGKPGARPSQSVSIPKQSVSEKSHAGQNPIQSVASGHSKLHSDSTRGQTGSSSHHQMSGNLKILTGLSQSVPDLNQGKSTHRKSIPTVSQVSAAGRKSIPSLMDINPTAPLVIPSLMDKEISPPRSGSGAALLGTGTSRSGSGTPQPGQPGFGSFTSLLGAMPANQLIPGLLNFTLGSMPAVGTSLLGPVPGTLQLGGAGVTIPGVSSIHGGTVRPGSRAGQRISGTPTRQVVNPWEVKIEPLDSGRSDHRIAHQRQSSSSSHRQSRPPGTDPQRRSSTASTSLERHHVLPPPPISPLIPSASGTCAINKTFEMKKVKEELLDDGYNVSRHGNTSSSSSQKPASSQPQAGRSQQRAERNVPPTSHTNAMFQLGGVRKELTADEIRANQIRHQGKSASAQHKQSGSSAQSRSSSTSQQSRRPKQNTPAVNRTARDLPIDVFQVLGYSPSAPISSKVKTPAEIKQEIADDSN